MPYCPYAILSVPSCSYQRWTIWFRPMVSHGHCHLSLSDTCWTV